MSQFASISLQQTHNAALHGLPTRLTPPPSRPFPPGNVVVGQFEDSDGGNSRSDNDGDDDVTFTGSVISSRGKETAPAGMKGEEVVSSIKKNMRSETTIVMPKRRLQEAFACQQQARASPRSTSPPSSTSLAPSTAPSPSLPPPVIPQLSPTGLTLPTYEAVDAVAVREAVARKLENAAHGEIRGSATGAPCSPPRSTPPSPQPNMSVDVSTSPRKFYNDSSTSPIKIETTTSTGTSPQRFFAASPPPPPPPPPPTLPSPVSTLHRKLLSCRVFARLGKQYHLFTALYRWRINSLPPTYVRSAAAACDGGTRGLEEVGETCIFALRTRLVGGEDGRARDSCSILRDNESTLLKPPMMGVREEEAKVKPVEYTHVEDILPPPTGPEVIDFDRLGLHLPSDKSGAVVSLLPLEYRDSVKTMFARYATEAPLEAIQVSFPPKWKEEEEDHGRREETTSLVSRFADLSVEGLFRKNEDSAGSGSVCREILEGRSALKTASFKRGVARDAVRKSNESAKKSIKWLTTPIKGGASSGLEKEAAAATPRAEKSVRKAGSPFRSPLRDLNSRGVSAHSPFSPEGSSVLRSLRTRIDSVGEELILKQVAQREGREELEKMRARLAENAERRKAPRTDTVRRLDELDVELSRRRGERSVEAVGFATELVKKITTPVLQGRAGGGSGAAYNLSFLSGLKGIALGSKLDDVSRISDATE